MGHPDFVDEFAKIVLQLWHLPAEEGLGLLRRWSPMGRNRPFDGELHTFTRSLNCASIMVSRLSDRGLNVRFAPVPASLVPCFAGRDGHTPETPQVAYWVVGSASHFPISRWIRDFVPPNPNRSVRHLTIAGKEDLPLSHPDANQLLSDLFRRPITLGEVLDTFEIDVPGYIVDQLRLDRFDESGVSIQWDIATSSGEKAGQLRGWIPNVPPPGTPWIAWGDSINAELHESSGKTTLSQHVKQGLGTRSMQRVLTFLWQLGLNAMDMEARWDGIAFMTRLGFDFVTGKDREATKAAFRNYLETQGISLSPQKLLDLDNIQHAWNLYDFETESGDPIGRNFLTHFGNVEQRTLPLRFLFQSDYPGWTRLFNNQLQRQAPDERLQQIRSRESMARRRDAVANHLRQASLIPLLLDPSIPIEFRRQHAASANAAIFFETIARKAQEDAERDTLTNLLNRSALEGLNRDLENGMSEIRDEEHPRRHWVLMIDIDHFKRINDTHGHHAGDEVLRNVASRMQETSRNVDVVVRYGGEEFCVVLRHSGRRGAELAAERLRRQIDERPFSLANGKQIDVSVSIGAAPFHVITPTETRGENEAANPFEDRPKPKTSLDLAIHNADVALYRAKEAGRNRVEFK